MSHEDEIAWRDARIAELEEQNAVLLALVESQARRIEKLERHLGLDSTNSSMPPSSDRPKARAQRKKTSKKTRTRGGQPGHKGHKREMLPEDQVDHIVDHYPTQCDCGLELGAEHVTGEPVRSQHFELVPKLTECTEHRRHACLCPGCGKITRADKLAAPDRLGWGPRLTGLLAAMSVMLHATRGKLDWFTRHVLGAPSSKASVQNYLEETSRALAPVHAQAREHLHACTHIGCDETGWRLGRLPYWIWLGQSPSVAFVQIRSRRTKACAREMLEGAQARVITTDRYGAYSWLDAHRNQICRAHLLRDWTAMSQRTGKLGELGSELVELEKRLHKRWREYRAEQLSRADFVEKANQLRAEIEQRCVEADRCSDAPGVVRWVMDPKHSARCWVFLEHEDVALTNNQSERDVRTCVIQRKLSFGSQSEEGLRLMERLWTVGLTCLRQKRNVLDFITEAVSTHRAGELPPLLF